MRKSKSKKKRHYLSDSDIYELERKLQRVYRNKSNRTFKHNTFDEYSPPCTPLNSPMDSNESSKETSPETQTKTISIACISDKFGKHNCDERQNVLTNTPKNSDLQVSVPKLNTEEPLLTKTQDKCQHKI